MMSAARQAASGKPISATYSQVATAATTAARRLGTRKDCTTARISPLTTPTWNPEIASRCAILVRAKASRRSLSSPSFLARIKAETSGPRSP